MLTQNLLCKINIRVRTLLKRKTWVRLQLPDAQLLLTGKRVGLCKEDTGGTYDERMEFQLLLPQQLLQYPTVLLADVQYPDLAFQTADIAYHIDRPGLPQRQIILACIKMLGHFNERLDRKGIVLHGHSEYSAEGAVFSVGLYDVLVLLIQGADLHKKLLALRCGDHALMCAQKYRNADLCFHLLHGTGQGRLCNEQLFGCFVHGVTFLNGQQIIDLL